MIHCGPVTGDRCKPESTSRRGPRNPLLVHHVIVASVRLVCGLNLAAPQYDPLACLSVMELVSDNRMPFWQSTAVTDALTHLSLLTN